MAERIYLLVDPRVSDPILRIRYVGLTRKKLARRLAQHIGDAYRMKNYRQRWMTGLARIGVVPEIELYAEVPDGNGPAAERAAIVLLGMLGASLTNLTVGGEGVIGYDHRPETRQRLSEVHTGRILSTERRERIRIGLLRAWSEGRRKNPKTPTHLWTQEVRAKISAAHKGRTLPADRRAQISAALTGLKQSDATRAKRSASLRGNTNGRGAVWTLEMRRRQAEITSGWTPQMRSRHAEIMSEWWARRKGDS